MAMPAPQVSLPAVAPRGGSQRQISILWILISVCGAAVGAVVAWQVRSLAVGGPISAQQFASYVETILGAVILSGAQWCVLRHYKLDAFWWVPASVLAELIAGSFVIPAIVNLAPKGTASPVDSSTLVVYASVGQVAAGFILGTAQALVLRTLSGNLVWAWIPATTLGTGVAAVLTTVAALSTGTSWGSWLFGLPAVVLIGLLAVVQAVFSSACQAPVLVRVVR